MSLIQVQRIDLLVLHSSRGAGTEADPVRRLYTLLDPVSGKKVLEVDGLTDRDKHREVWMLLATARDVER
jgi:hypothetical protein